MLLDEAEIPPGVLYYKMISADRFTRHMRLNPDVKNSPLSQDTRERVLAVTTQTNSESPVYSLENLWQLIF